MEDNVKSTRSNQTTRASGAPIERRAWVFSVLLAGFGCWLLLTGTIALAAPAFYLDRIAGGTLTGPSVVERGWIGVVAGSLFLSFASHLYATVVRRPIDRSLLEYDGETDRSNS